jgi:hypothetical protein
MGTISTSNSSYDVCCHFKVSENARFAIPKDTQTIPLGWNPKLNLPWPQSQTLHPKPNKKTTIEN